jgi:hypothetical protein
MSRTLVAAVAGCLVILAAVPVAGAANGPKLRLIGSQPVVVKGESFHPGERVVVTALTLTGPRRVVVRATPAGRFGATIRVLRQPCGKPFAVRAVGGLGSRAVLSVPGTACVPPPID